MVYDYRQVRSYHYAQKPGLADKFVKIHIFTDLYPDGWKSVNKRSLFDSLYFMNTFSFENQHMKYTR